MANVAVIQVGPVDFEVRVGGTVVKECATVRTANSFATRLEDLHELMMQDIRRQHHEMCDSAHLLGQPCFSSVVPN